MNKTTTTNHIYTQPRTSHDANDVYVNNLGRPMPTTPHYSLPNALLPPPQASLEHPIYNARRHEHMCFIHDDKLKKKF